MSVPHEHGLRGEEGEKEEGMGASEKAFKEGACGKKTRVRRNRTSGPLRPYGFEVRNQNQRMSVPHVHGVRGEGGEKGRGWGVVKKT